EPRSERLLRDRLHVRSLLVHVGADARARVSALIDTTMSRRDRPNDAVTGVDVLPGRVALQIAGTIRVRPAPRRNEAAYLGQVVDLNTSSTELQVEVAVRDVHPALAGRHRNSDGEVNLLDGDGPARVGRETPHGPPENRGEKP